MTKGAVGNELHHDSRLLLEPGGLKCNARKAPEVARGIERDIMSQRLHNNDGYSNNDLIAPCYLGQREHVGYYFQSLSSSKTI